MRIEDWIEWEVCSRAFPGEAVSGDVCVTAPCAGGLLLAAIDGLGHGHRAAEAARRAADIMQASPEDPLDVMVTRCHRALRGTRGVAMTVAFVHRDGRLRWLGVGNVEAVVSRTSAGRGALRDSIMLLSGVVGQQIPALRPAETALSCGDMLVLATDGIRSTFLEALTPRADTAARTARRILAEYGKQTDDALVVAATFLGSHA